MAESSGVSGATLFLDGMWFSPGQEPKRMQVYKEGIVFNVAFGTACSPHGFHSFVTYSGEDGSQKQMLCLGFHHSNVNCAALKGEAIAFKRKQCVSR